MQDSKPASRPENEKSMELSREYSDFFRAVSQRASQDDQDELEQRIGFKGSDECNFL